MATYFDALEPAVIFSDKAIPLDVRILVVGFTSVRLGRAEGVVPGVTRPFEKEGVIRPLLEGVIRPLEDDDDSVARTVESESDPDGVIRPDRAGVMRPREEATDDGRDIAPGPTVGGDSFAVATNTPHLSGHEKYCFLKRSCISMSQNDEDLG